MELLSTVNTIKISDYINDDQEYIIKDSSSTIRPPIGPPVNGVMMYARSQKDQSKKKQYAIIFTTVLDKNLGASGTYDMKDNLVMAQKIQCELRLRLEISQNEGYDKRYEGGH